MEKLEELFKEYLETLSDEGEVSMWGTWRSHAQWQIEDFIEWMKINDKELK